MQQNSEILNTEPTVLDTDVTADFSGTPEEEEAKNAEAFRVFKTREDFQSFFDKALGKRLREKRESDNELLRLRELSQKACKKLGIENLSQLEDLENAPQNSDGEEFPSAESIQNELSKYSEEGEIYSSAKAESLTQNERFTSLIKSGFSVKDAFDALNLGQILQSEREKAKDEVLREIRTRGLRPTEDAVSGYGSFSATFDPKNLTDAQRADLRERVRRGERITF